MLIVVVGLRNIVRSGCREVTDANEKLEADEVGPDASRGRGGNASGTLGTSRLLGVGFDKPKLARDGEGRHDSAYSIFAGFETN